MKYRNYIFDLYGTLIDIHTDEESLELWEFMADYLKCHFDTITTAAELKNDYIRICADETEKLAARNGSKYPEIKIEWVWKRLIKTSCTDVEMKELCIAFREKSRDKLNCYNNVHNVLRQIKENGGHVYLLSNAQRLFTEKELDDTGLTDFFDDIFISSDMEIKKPDTAFINQLLEKHNLVKAESVMVGNEIKADIGYGKSDIEVTIIDEGDDCFCSLPVI